MYEMQFCNIELTFHSHGYVCIGIIYKYVFHNVLIFYLAYYCTLVKINLLEFLCKKTKNTTVLMLRPLRGSKLPHLSVCCPLSNKCVVSLPWKCKQIVTCVKSKLLAYLSDRKLAGVVVELVN